MKHIHVAASAAILAASIAGPIVAWRHLRVALRDQSENRKRQEMEIAALAEENKHLAGNVSLGQATLSEQQLHDLLRLRAEAAALRRETNDSTRVASANNRPGSGTTRAEDSGSPQSDDEQAAELSSDTLEAMKATLKVLPGVLDRFAQDHAGKVPAQFSDLRKYFPNVDGKRMPGIYTFQFVREEGTKPGDVLILKEQSYRVQPGKASKIYGFSNGQAVEITLPDGGEAQRNFARWESQYLDGPPGLPKDAQHTNE